MKHDFKRADSVLAVVRNLLDTGKPGEAAGVLRRFATGSLELGNAYGVCLMRAGDFSRAVEVFRNLALSGGGVCLKADVPTAVKTNFALALLLAGNVCGCLSTLQEIGQEEDPMIIRLRAAIDRWRASLTRWQRLWFKASGEAPAKPVPLDFAPGELFEEGPLRPAA